jgi:hypothetical protein
MPSESGGGPTMGSRNGSGSTFSPGDLSARLRQIFQVQGNSELSWSALRGRYIYALHAIAEFLGKNSKDAETSQRFIYLASALDALDAGAVHPVLKHKGGGRPRDISEVSELQALAGSGVECLLRAGVTRKEIKDASRKYARRFPGLVHLVRSGRSGPKRDSDISLGGSMLSWRDRVMEADKVRKVGGKRKRGPHFQDPIAAGRAQEFRNFIKDKGQWPLDRFRQGAERLLQSASNKAAKLRLPSPKKSI